MTVMGEREDLLAQMMRAALDRQIEHALRHGAAPAPVRVLSPLPRGLRFEDVAPRPWWSLSPLDGKPNG
jgi:hypothetical protein